MAEKEISNIIKLQIEAGKATPAPPVGPALGSSGVNIMQFVKEFNDRTANQPGMIIPVVITVYKDKSFEFITKVPPVAVLIKKAIKIENIYLLNKFYKTDSNKYNIVIFDNPQISFLKKTELLNNSTNIFLSECNLLGIKKLSKLIGIITKDIRKENINIIFNKYNSNSLDKDILYNIFKSIKILGKIDYSKKIDAILNTEKIINIKSLRKDLLKIRDNLLKENKVYGDRHTKRIK